MKSLSTLFSVTVLTLTLTACMHNRSEDYVKAQNNAPLKTPPGVSNATFTDHNPIPQTSTTGVITVPSLVPPGLTEDEAAAKIALTVTEKNKNLQP